MRRGRILEEERMVTYRQGEYRAICLWKKDDRDLHY